MLDLFGKAILDFQTNNAPEDIITETSISVADEMSIAYLFRSFSEMPKIEQKALKLSYGKILDVGCGAGSHSLYLQNNKNFDVTAIDISTNAIQACQLRGLKKIQVQNILEMGIAKFDTILLLMNGTGIFRTVSEASKYIQKMKSLLNSNGQILIDSSDIIYMFDKDKKGNYKVPKKKYYGELTFSIQYKGQIEDSFPWLYLDFNTLQNIAITNKMQCELIMKGDHYDYLAKLS
jgi:SAM-dependent methyltransferase